MNKLYIFLLGIFLISFVSAGLNIQNNTININKTSGIDQYFNIIISNTYGNTFYNISSQNNVISFDKFNLDSGQNKTIQVKTSTNSDFNEQVKIIGDYFDELGSSNETIEITIDSSGQVDICNLDLIVGDTIIWENTRLSGNRILKNLNSGEDFATINPESTYTETFTESKEFDYQVFGVGMPISNICHINIRPTKGFIHSSEYDTLINLNIKINYEPTTISSTFFTDSYTLNYNGQTEDVFKIINTGDKIAKNIKLTGDWFEFDINNFDLAIGEQKNIGYTIKPFVYQTDQTNKTYNKSITIEGNFGTINKQIDVFINYKDLSGIYANSSYDKEFLQNIVNFYCSVYPDDCPKTVIFGDETSKNVTFTINEETYKQGILEEDSFREEMKSMLRTYSESLTSLKNANDLALNNSEITSNEVKDLSNKTDNLLSAYIFGLIIIVISVIVIVVIILLFSQKARLKLNKVFHKGELPC